MMPSENRRAFKRARQKFLIFALGLALMAGGFVVLLFLKRLPLPLRVVMGFGDFVAGCVLLVVLRQKFSEK